VRPISILLAGSLLLPAPRAFADDCDGDPDKILELPATAARGETILVSLHGPAGEMGLFLASTGEGPTPTKYGTLCLDLPAFFTLPFRFDENGEFSFEVDIPCDVEIIGVTVYAQFLTCNKPNRGVSNQVAITFTDGLCVGDMVTYTPGGWGVECHGHNAGCLLEEWFDVLFPEGITLGDQDGADGDDEYSLHFTSAAAVTAFLPAGGKPDLLTEDATDPTDSSAGEFAGALLAAKINVAMDEAGFFDDLKERDDLQLLDLIFDNGVNVDLIGLSVREVIDICDLAISGALGDGDLDIDGDGDPDSTLSDLASSLSGLNENFDNGGVNLGKLRL